MAKISELEMESVDSSDIDNIERLKKYEADVKAVEHIKSIANEGRLMHKRDSVEHSLGLNDPLPESLRQEAIELAKEQLEKMDAYNITKNLDRDLFTVDKQNYCVVSWVGPHLTAKTDTPGFRIMGAFDDIKKSKKHIEKIYKRNSKYDLGIMEMYKWCFAYPDNSDYIYDHEGNIDEQATTQNVDEMLNNCIIKQKVLIEEKKQLFEARKRGLMKSSMIKEGNIEEAIIKEVPKGAPCSEYETIHKEEIKKWTESENIDKTDKSNDIQTDSDSDSDSDSDLMYDADENEHDFLDNTKLIKRNSQNYAVVSFVNPTGNSNERIPMMIRGVFRFLEEAYTYASQIIEADDTFDILITPLYEWVPCNPNIDKLRVVYKDEGLNELLNNKNKDDTSINQVHTFNKHLETEKTPCIGNNIIDCSQSDEIIEMADSEDIRLKAKEYHEKYAGEYIDEPDTKSPQGMKRPAFVNLTEQLSNFEQTVKEIMDEHECDREKALSIIRERVGGKTIAPKQSILDQINENEENYVSKPSKPSINFKEMSAKIDQLKKSGKTAAEIRKIMSEMNETE